MIAQNSTSRHGNTVSVKVSSSGRSAVKPGKAATEWELPSGVKDGLTSSVAACMRLRGNDVGEDALTSGLALENTARITPRLAVRAADAHGFRTSLTRRALDDIPKTVLPAVLFLKDRDACVLVARQGDTARIVWPTRSDSEFDISLSELADAYIGHVLLLQPEPAFQQDAPEPNMMRHWYWSIASRYWPDYIQVVFASAAVNVMALAVPLFTMNVYDRVFPNAALITLWSLVAGVAIALFFDAILKWLRARIVDSVSRRIDLAVSSEIFRHIADLRLDVAAQPAGTLINNLKDYEQVRDFFSSQTLATLTDFVFGVLFIVVIAYIGGPLAWPPALAFGFVLILGLCIIVPLRSASNLNRQVTGVKNAVAVEAITDLETLKAVSGQNRMQARWERYVTESAQSQERSKRLAAFATTSTATAQQAASVGIVVIGVYLALDGSLTMGSVIAAMILSGRALAPTAALSSLFVRGSFAFSTLRSLNAVMQTTSDKSAPGRALNAGAERGNFDVKSVSLQYPGSTLPALKNVSFKSGANERIGLVGSVGAGKTSLVRLLSGLYAPSDGLVLINGLNIAQISPARLRREVQLVPQEAVLFSGTLAENIAFGTPQASNEELLRVARLTGVDKIAAMHPEGFGMQITERGRNLSGGQRQMVALARALLPRPKVLILDEPTSSMDTQNEKIFVENLSRVIAEWPMTVFISTHRMGLLDLVDRLILLNAGKLVADGPKDAVLKDLAQSAKTDAP